MAYAQNLRLKGGCYHFRKRIPATLRDRIGRHEIVRSLETSDCRIASRRARLLWLCLHRVLDWVAGDITITKVQIEAAMKRFADEIDWADEIRLASSGQMFEHHGDAPWDADAIILEGLACEHQEALARNDVSGVRREIDHVKADFDHTLTQIDEQLLGRAILGVLTSSGERTAQRLRNEVYPHLYPDQTTASSNDQAQEAEASFHRANVGRTFSEAWASAMRDNMAARHWMKGKVAHAASSLKLWLDIHGDRDLAEITSEMAVSFRMMVAQLPERYHRDTRWQGMPVAEIVAATNKLSEDADEEVARVDTKTVNRHISTLKTTWKTFQTLHYVPSNWPNPFQGLHVTVSKATEDIQEERDQFTPDEVKTLFGSPIWTGCKSASRRNEPGTLIIRDWRYWVPLIGAHTGMRREEICALRVGDIERVAGIWIINLRKAKKRLKTPGSARYVPLHRQLLEWSFVSDLVEGRSANEWLFPDLKPNSRGGRFGERFGKWFTLLRQSLGIYRRKVVFHSFRHTVATALHNAEAYPPFIEEITGHESEERRSEIRRYTKPALVAKLKSAIDLLDYGLQLRETGDSSQQHP